MPLESIFGGAHWSAQQLVLNVHLILHLLGAFALGVVMGYERAYRGRAAGMRTYGFVCMASAALTIMMAFPESWFGGRAVWGFADPSRVIQGIVTGLGFLGAGVIMKDTNNNIRGLSTAGSLWVASAVGIFIGLGFYMAAIAMALITTLSLAGVSMIQSLLPANLTLHVRLTVEHGCELCERTISSALQKYGFTLQTSSISLGWGKQGFEWQFAVSTQNQNASVFAQKITQALKEVPNIIEFHVNPSRN